MIADSMLQLTFKKQLSVEFWHRIKGEYPLFSENSIKTLFHFPTTYLCETGFPSSTSNKITNLQQIKSRKTNKVQLPSIRPGIKNIYKTHKQCTLSTKLLLGELLFFREMCFVSKNGFLIAICK